MPAKKNAPKSTALSKNVIEGESSGGSGSRALSLIDQELAQEATGISNQIGQLGGGNRIEVKPDGTFNLPDGTVFDGEMKIVVVDFATHHDYYEAQYNPNNPVPPICYARGKNLDELKPEADSPDIQNPDCKSCPLNQFGSGPNGKSKACKNSRALAVLIVDPDQPDAHNAPDAPLYSFKLPPTALKSFDAAIAGLTRTLGHPIKGTLNVYAKPVGTYALISFGDPEPNDNYAEHAARRGEAHDILYRKPDFAAYEAKQAQGTNNRRGNRAAPARGARR
jgi:hypothetical protein